MPRPNSSITEGMIVPTESVVIANIANIRHISSLRNRVDAGPPACVWPVMRFPPARRSARAYERPNARAAGGSCCRPGDLRVGAQRPLAPGPGRHRAGPRGNARRRLAVLDPVHQRGEGIEAVGCRTALAMPHPGNRKDPRELRRLPAVAAIGFLP